jgi:hypothetical protein
MRAMMDFKTLILKYETLLAENKALKEEVLSLKAQLGSAEPVGNLPCPGGAQQDVSRVSVLRDVCKAFEVPVAIERSAPALVLTPGIFSLTRLPRAWREGSVPRCSPMP